MIVTNDDEMCVCVCAVITNSSIHDRMMTMMIIMMITCTVGVIVEKQIIILPEKKIRIFQYICT